MSVLDEILHELKSLGKRVESLEESHAATSAGAAIKSGKKIAIKEFILECKPKGNVQLMLTIGYFLETNDGMSSFNINDLENGFRAAKETPPVNISDTANKCVKQGYMMEEKDAKDNKKAWVITSSGENFIRCHFKKQE